MRARLDSQATLRAGSTALVLGAAALAALPLASAGPPPSASDVPKMLVVDLHVDLPYQVHFKGRPEALPEGHARPSTLATGAYGGLVFPIYIPDYLHKSHPTVEDAEDIFKTVERIVAKSPIFMPIRSSHHEPGRVGAWVSIEGAGAFAADVNAIDRFIERGVRLIGPVHYRNGPLASAATDRPRGGLTDAGKRFCDRVYEKGALVDVSHMSDLGFADVVPIAAKYNAPIVATHSNTRAVFKHNRNLTDAQLAKIGETGGVVGVNFYSAYVTDAPTPKMLDLVKHIEHAVRVAGIDHVAIGSDFDGGITPVEGLEDASALPRLARYLVTARGMSEDDVLKIFSLNALRVLAWSNTAPPKK